MKFHITDFNKCFGKITINLSNYFKYYLIGFSKVVYFLRTPIPKETRQNDRSIKKLQLKVNNGHFGTERNNI